MFRIAVGGPASGAINASAVTAKRVVLRYWGFNGAVVPGGVNASGDTFQMQVNGFAPCWFRKPSQSPSLTISSIMTDSHYSLTSRRLPTCVFGLLLKNPVNGNAIFVGHYVDDLN